MRDPNSKSMHLLSLLLSKSGIFFICPNSVPNWRQMGGSVDFVSISIGGGGGKKPFLEHLTAATQIVVFFQGWFVTNAGYVGFWQKRKINILTYDV